MQQIPYHCKLHTITDSFGLEAWVKLNLLFWYVSVRVGFNLNTLFTGAMLCYFRYFILLLLSSLNKNRKMLKTIENRKQNTWLGGSRMVELNLIFSAQKLIYGSFSRSEISFASRLTKIRLWTGDLLPRVPEVFDP